VQYNYSSERTKKTSRFIVSTFHMHSSLFPLLFSSQGTEAIEGLALKMHLTSRDCFKADSFQKMERLRLLQLHHVQLAGNYGYLSKQLRWISWQGFPSNFLPNNFYMDHVIAIDLKHSHLRFLWKQSPVFITCLSLVKFTD